MQRHKDFDRGCCRIKPLFKDNS